jgi:hypothetical protein
VGSLQIQTFLSWLGVGLDWLRVNAPFIVELLVCLCLGCLFRLSQRLSAIERLVRDVKWVNKP